MSTSTTWSYVQEDATAEFSSAVSVVRAIGYSLVPKVIYTVNLITFMYVSSLVIAINTALVLHCFKLAMSVGCLKSIILFAELFFWLDLRSHHQTD